MTKFTRRTLVRGATAVAAGGALTGPALLAWAKAWAQTAPWKPERGAQLSLLRCQRHQGRNHLGRPSEQGRPWLQHREFLVRCCKAECVGWRLVIARPAAPGLSYYWRGSETPPKGARGPHSRRLTSRLVSPTAVPPSTVQATT